jgi:hypothetical protein
MNDSPLLAGSAAGSPLLTVGGALSPKDDNGATPLSTGASAGSCELRRLTESLLSTRPGDRLLVNLLRFRVYGLLISVFTSIYQRGNLLTCILHRTWCSWCKDCGSPNRIAPTNRQSTSANLINAEVNVEIKWALSAPASEITYLSLVADDARARHGGDRMVERW